VEEHITLQVVVAVELNLLELQVLADLAAEEQEMLVVEVVITDQELMEPQILAAEAAVVIKVAMTIKQETVAQE
jgi:hypothetical protein